MSQRRRPPSLIVTFITQELDRLASVGFEHLPKSKELQNTLDRLLIAFIPQFTQGLLSVQYILHSEAVFFRTFSNHRPRANPLKLMVTWITVLNRNQDDRNTLSKQCVLAPSLAQTIKRLVQAAIDEAKTIDNENSTPEEVKKFITTLIQKNANVLLAEKKNIGFYQQYYLHHLEAKLYTLLNLDMLVNDLMENKEITDPTPYCSYLLTDAMLLLSARNVMDLACNATLLSAGAANIGTNKTQGAIIAQIYSNPFNHSGIEAHESPERHLIHAEQPNQENFLRSTRIARCDAQSRALHYFVDMLHMLPEQYRAEPLSTAAKMISQLLKNANELQMALTNHIHDRKTPNEAFIDQHLAQAFIVLDQAYKIQKLAEERLKSPDTGGDEDPIYLKIGEIFHPIDDRIASSKASSSHK